MNTLFNSFCSNLKISFILIIFLFQYYQLFHLDYWGVSICTVDGQRYSIGDTNIPFTIQSSGKPINYAIALSELGSDVVHKYVGQESSGRMFNELILDHEKKPHNPMVNAGAIIICSLLIRLIKVLETSINI